MRPARKQFTTEATMNPIGVLVVFWAGLYLTAHATMCAALDIDPATSPDIFDLIGL